MKARGKHRAKSPLARHREHKIRAGYVRVEVNVPREDAGLVRDVAAALTDPERQADARILLRRRFSTLPSISLKDVLASGPPDDIDLTRPSDFGRDVEL